MQKKDPAFLFYSKDWLEGTAEMTPEEKGVYIDLLAHQHQKGDLPVETKRLAKLAGLGEAEFLVIWKDISCKFQPNQDNRLVNRKLTEVTTERSDKGHTNKITSALAVAVRLCDLPYEVKNAAKKGFKADDFWDVPEPKITESVTEWFNQRLKSIANANEDANEDANEIKGSAEGGKEVVEKFLIPEMLDVFTKSRKTYSADISRDFKPLQSISKFIHDQSKLNGNHVENKGIIIKKWEQLCSTIEDDKFYSTKSLSTISNHIQELYQIQQHGRTTSTKSHSTGRYQPKGTGGY